MRWLFVLLLCLNVAYVAWEYRNGSNEATYGARPAPQEGVASIVLLREIAPAGDAVVVFPPSAAQVPGADAGDGDAVASGTEPLETAAAEEKPVPGAGDKNALAAAAEVVSAAVVEPEPEPSLGISSGPIAQPPSAVETGFACFTLGPFDNMDDLRAVIRDIKDYVAEASFRSKEESEASRYRVYLAPSGGLEDAKETTARLRSKGVKDSFIIASGPQKHGVSLGYFSEKQRALNHTDSIRRKGFDPVFEPVFSSYTLYWLDYRIREGAEIPADLLKRASMPDLGRLSRACP